MPIYDAASAEQLIGDIREAIDSPEETTAERLTIIYRAELDNIERRSTTEPDPTFARILATDILDGLIRTAVFERLPQTRPYRELMLDVDRALMAIRERSKHWDEVLSKSRIERVIPGAFFGTVVSGTGSEKEKNSDTRDPIERPRKQDIAVGILMSNPELSDKQIANLAGCDPSLLSKSPMYKEVRKAQKAQRSAIRRKHVEPPADSISDEDDDPS